MQKVLSFIFLILFRTVCLRISYVNSKIYLINFDSSPKKIDGLHSFKV